MQELKENLIKLKEYAKVHDELKRIQNFDSLSLGPNTQFSTKSFSKGKGVRALPALHLKSPGLLDF